jgi:CheY-like chemotaxis protein
VLMAHDGEAAVSVARAERSDVVLLDIGLPKLSGLEACRAMREAGMRSTLIVAISGYGQEADRRASLDAGFDAHWVKPVDAARLRDLIAQRAAEAAER